MQEPDMHYETALQLDIDEATQNLSENLHLKWNYALLYLDKYSDEHGMPVSVVSGIRKQEETSYYLRLSLVQEKKGSYIKVDIWKVNTAGWPFPTGIPINSEATTDKLIDLVDEILKFCATPYENTRGVIPWLRNMFAGRLETRQYDN